MCVSTAVAAIIISVASTALTAYASVRQGSAVAAQQKFDAAVSRNNSLIAEAQAEDAIRRGKLDARRKRVATGRLTGSQIAAFAANNIQVGFGSPLDVILDTVASGELDAQIIRANAEREAFSFKTQAQNFRASADLSLLRGSAAKTAGILGAGSSILSGASKVFGMIDKLPRSVGTG